MGVRPYHVSHCWFDGWFLLEVFFNDAWIRYAVDWCCLGAKPWRTTAKLLPLRLLYPAPEVWIRRRRKPHLKDLKNRPASVRFFGHSPSLSKKAFKTVSDYRSQLDFLLTNSDSNLVFVYKALTKRASTFSVPALQCYSITFPVAIASLRRHTMGHAAAPDAAQRRGSTAGGGAREHGARVESDRATRVAGWVMAGWCFGELTLASLVMVNMVKNNNFWRQSGWGAVQFPRVFSLVQAVPAPSSDHFSTLNQTLAGVVKCPILGILDITL